MLGVFVNVFAVLLGGFLGVLFKKGIPQKVEKCVMSALGLCVVVIGIDGALDGMDKNASNLWQAEYTRDHVLSAMTDVRSAADALEVLVSKEYWPMPDYQELLTSV